MVWMQISRVLLVCDFKIIQVGRKNLAVRFDRDQDTTASASSPARAVGGVRLYSRPDNDFTRRFPLIADAPPKWLSKKCRPLSKKCKLTALQPHKWVPGGGRAAHPSAKKAIMKIRALPWKAGIGYPLP